MKNLTIVIAFFLVGTSLFAQVGINNTDPKASLDITASNVATPANTDGILIPRIDEFPVTDPGADQDGMLVYLTGNGTPPQGFYFWDNGGSIWSNLVGAKNTLDEAYDQGGTGAGRTITADNGAVSIQGVDGFEITGTFGSGATIGSPGGGTRMLFNPSKSSFRAGTVVGTEWDDSNVGEYSAAFGNGNTASGNISFAMGLGNIASAESAVAFGAANTSSGQEAVSFGNQNVASGLRSAVFGSQSTASGDHSFVVGETAEATGTNGIAMGNGAMANFTDALALGKTSEAKNTLATAIGGGDAQGVSSVSIGEGTVALSFSEIAMGTFNTGYVPNSLTAFDADDRLFAIGNGISNGNRNNALTILKNGYTGINTDNPRNPLEIKISTTFDLSHVNSGQDGVYIVGQGDNSGINAIGGSISFGPPNTTRGEQRKSAIASIQTSGDVDHTGLAFFVHGNAINTSPMVEGMRLTHNNRLGINNTAPSANLDVIGTMQYEDGNEAIGYVLTSDATGNATWIDPSTLVSLVDKIDDLSDGKSDSDGTDDGSSVFLGVSSGAADDSSDNKNVGIGYQSLQNNSSGENNVGVGYLALQNNTTGSQNTAIGLSSLLTNTIGDGNTAIGYHALFGNNDGINNTATGHGALNSNVSGGYNTANGVQALFFTSGGSNTGSGYRALYTNTSGARNTAHGLESLNLNSSGSDNVAVGYRAGRSSLGSNNIFIGASAGFSETGGNKLYIESSNADADNALIYGEFDNDILRINGEVQVGNPTGTGYALPTADGTAAQVLSTDGSGATSWQDSPANFALAKMTMSANQTLVGGPNKLNFDTAAFDLNSNFDAATDRFDVTETGYYRINANFRNSSSITTSATYDLSIRINGITAAKSDTRREHNTSDFVARTVETIEFLTAGDFIEIYAGGAGLIVSQFSAYTSFEVERIR